MVTPADPITEVLDRARAAWISGRDGRRDDAARSFAIGLGRLGERESVAAACEEGCAAISLDGLRERARPQLAVRADVDAGKLVLAADPR